MSKTNDKKCQRGSSTQSSVGDNVDSCLSKCLEDLKKHFDISLGAIKQEIKNEIKDTASKLKGSLKSTESAWEEISALKTKHNTLKQEHSILKASCDELTKENMCLKNK